MLHDELDLKINMGHTPYSIHRQAAHRAGA